MMAMVKATTHKPPRIIGIIIRCIQLADYRYPSTFKATVIEKGQKKSQKRPIIVYFYF